MQYGLPIAFGCDGSVDFNLFMIACFAVGGLVCAVLCPLFGGKALWGALIPLAVVFVDLLYADLKTEKDYLDRIPRGH